MWINAGIRALSFTNFKTITRIKGIERRWAGKLAKNSLPTRLKPNTNSIGKELVTVFDVYRYAVTQFSKADLSYGHVTLTPWEDASFLIMHELALPHADPITHWSNARLTAEEKEHLLELIDLRISKKLPVAYLVKGCYYQGEYFYIDERALIPRSYLGEILHNPHIVQGLSTSDAMKFKSPSNLIENVELDYNDYIGEIVDEHKASLLSTSLSPALSPPVTVQLNKIHRILDLCTGSGCLAVIASKIFANSRIDAVDISPLALEVAKINIHELKDLSDRIFLFQGDLYTPLTGRKYDLIISNPPYVSPMRMRHLYPEYRHEPPLALAAGVDGLLYIEKIINQASVHLTEGGLLLLEIGATKREFEQKFPRLVKHKGMRYIETSLSKDEVILATREALEDIIKK